MPNELRADKRIRVLAALCIIVMAIFVVRLFQLQVIDHGKYVSLARQEQEKRLIIPATRGEIYLMDDNKPVKTVFNQTVYTMFVDPGVVDEPERVIKTIREVVGGNTVKGYESSVYKDNTRYIVVAKKVSYTQAQLVRERKLKGVGFQAQSVREYPEESLAAQTLGFVDADGVGQYGIEGMYNNELKGKDGVLQSVTDVANVPLTIGDKNINIPPKNGKDIVLTLDRSVQAYAEQALVNGIKKAGADTGSVVVMDPSNGNIMAMANMPTYNPGELNKIQSFNQVNNGVVATPYEPGSVMKTFTLATGIDKGVISPDSTFVNTDYIRVDDRVISNATKGQTGTITLQHALNWSLNTGMVTVAQRLGDGSLNYKARSTMYDYLYNKFRLGQKTGIEVYGEAAGKIWSPDQVEGNAVRYSNMSFGQGMDLTMVQVAASFSALINGGTYHAPTVIGGSVNDEGQFAAAPKKASYKNVIKESTSEQMRNMIVEARNAFYGGNDRKGYTIGGKTGTSQTIVDGSYDNGQTIATYLGFGGDTKPKYVIMVQVSGKNKNLGGSSDAMPIFTDISNWIIDYLTLQPKG
jgi:cell division protein FtsI/penicillin-binding protein 2